ncbi:MAG TPA: hypothetical protein PKK66_05320 [Bacteroidales bacterium]|nr:hypothetical protein [Bacteroidales bacterium]
MKKIILCIVVCLIGVVSYAQNDVAGKPQNLLDKIDRPVVVRDRLVFDIYHSFWMGTPSQGNFKKFNPGFNVAVLWDFLTPKKGPVSFGLGLGFTYYTQFSNCVLKMDKEADAMKYYLIPDNIDYKLNRVSYVNCHIPFEIRYRHSSGFKIGVGINVGLVAGMSHRYKGDDFNGVEGDFLNYKNKDFYYKQKFSADVYLRMGWKAFGVFYSYQLNKVFDEGKGPKIYPMSVGVSISLF